MTEPIDLFDYYDGKMPDDAAYLITRNRHNIPVPRPLLPFPQEPLVSDPNNPDDVDLAKMVAASMARDRSGLVIKNWGKFFERNHADHPLFKYAQSLTLQPRQECFEKIQIAGDLWSFTTVEHKNNYLARRILWRWFQVPEHFQMAVELVYLYAFYLKDKTYGRKWELAIPPAALWIFKQLMRVVYIHNPQLLTTLHLEDLHFMLEDCDKPGPEFDAAWAYLCNVSNCAQVVASQALPRIVIRTLTCPADFQFCRYSILEMARDRQIRRFITSGDFPMPLDMDYNHHGTFVYGKLLYGTQWEPLPLDEGHWIRAAETRTAQKAMHLSEYIRWRPDFAPDPNRSPILGVDPQPGTPIPGYPAPEKTPVGPVGHSLPVFGSYFYTDRGVLVEPWGAVFLQMQRNARIFDGQGIEFDVNWVQADWKSGYFVATPSARATPSPQNWLPLVFTYDHPFEKLHREYFHSQPPMLAAVRINSNQERPLPQHQAKDPMNQYPQPMPTMMPAGHMPAPMMDANGRPYQQYPNHPYPQPLPGHGQVPMAGSFPHPGQPMAGMPSAGHMAAHMHPSQVAAQMSTAQPQVAYMQLPSGQIVPVHPQPMPGYPVHGHPGQPHMVPAVPYRQPYGGGVPTHPHAMTHQAPVDFTQLQHLTHHQGMPQRSVEAPASAASGTSFSGRVLGAPGGPQQAPQTPAAAPIPPRGPQRLQNDIQRAGVIPEGIHQVGITSVNQNVMPGGTQNPTVGAAIPCNWSVMDRNGILFRIHPDDAFELQMKHSCQVFDSNSDPIMIFRTEDFYNPGRHVWMVKAIGPDGQLSEPYKSDIRHIGPVKIPRGYKLENIMLGNYGYKLGQLQKEKQALYKRVCAIPDPIDLSGGEKGPELAKVFDPKYGDIPPDLRNIYDSFMEAPPVFPPYTPRHQPPQPQPQGVSYGMPPEIARDLPPSRPVTDEAIRSMYPPATLPKPVKVQPEAKAEAPAPAEPKAKPAAKKIDPRTVKLKGVPGLPIYHRNRVQMKIVEHDGKTKFEFVRRHVAEATKMIEATAGCRQVMMTKITADAKQGAAYMGAQTKPPLIDPGYGMDEDKFYELSEEARESILSERWDEANGREQILNEGVTHYLSEEEAFRDLSRQLIEANQDLDEDKRKNVMMKVVKIYSPEVFANPKKVTQMVMELADEATLNRAHETLAAYLNVAMKNLGENGSNSWVEDIMLVARRFTRAVNATLREVLSLPTTIDSFLEDWPNLHEYVKKNYDMDTSSLFTLIDPIVLEAAVQIDINGHQDKSMSAEDRAMLPYEADEVLFSKEVVGVKLNATLADLQLPLAVGGRAWITVAQEDSNIDHVPCLFRLFDSARAYFDQTKHKYLDLIVRLACGSTLRMTGNLDDDREYPQSAMVSILS